jgi:hypothetical protein
LRSISTTHTEHQYICFNADDDFVSTLGHELIHATGCASFGYSDIEAQSLAYIESWLKAD